MSDSARILVTGSTGFVAGALLPLLRARGYHVVEGPRGSDWNTLVAGCGAVVHLANIAHTTADRIALREINVEGTRRLAEQSAAAGVRRFVYLSSIKADAPDDDYGESKRAAEVALARVAGLQAVVLRPPLVYGPGVKANFLALMRAIRRGVPLPFAGVHNQRSLVYAGNLADAIALCVTAPAAAGRTYAVTDGAPVSTPVLCRAIGAAFHRPARLWAFPVPLLELAPPMRKLTRSLVADDSAIRQELGWRPPVAFEAGIAKTAAWYQAGRR